jgi:hypothetical protein
MAEEVGFFCKLLGMVNWIGFNVIGGKGKVGIGGGVAKLPGSVYKKK